LHLLELLKGLAPEVHSDRTTDVVHETLGDVFLAASVLDLPTNLQEVDSRLIGLPLVNVESSEALDVTKWDGVRKRFV
tara:strand:- start:132 stop:365 length:234 start_codon:yes stop_codon:yes gene_type:complete